MERLIPVLEAHAKTIGMQKEAFTFPLYRIVTLSPNRDAEPTLDPDHDRKAAEMKKARSLEESFDDK